MGRDAAALFEFIDKLPPIPAVATHVMALAADEKTSSAELAKVLSADQILTAQLIRLSNSAYYGYGRKVSSVREAVLLLGFEQVRQIAISTSMMSNMNQYTPAVDDGFDIDLFWGHSVAVAMIAEMVAKKTRVARPEDAFTAGILHDIGRLVLRQAMPKEFHYAMAMTKTRGIPLHEAEERTTGYRHDEVGRMLGDMWKFPGQLIDAIGSHHDEGLTIYGDGVSAVLALSNAYAIHHGLYCGYDMPEMEQGPLPPELEEIDRICNGVELVLNRAFAFIEAASGAPDRWYIASA